ncbi:MAG: hypothetical protein JWP69_1249 [Flaviaesturariibacter sp.]|nr:hypothetical protein [Flaviaesturariibacter sp.]
MRKNLYLLTPLLLWFFFSCQKERSFEVGAPGAGSLRDLGGECSPKTVGGSYVAARPLTDSNFMDVGVHVSKKGTYTISSNAVNGYSFRGNGSFTDTGLVVVRLKANGIPLAAGSDVFTITYDSTSCTVSVTVLPAGSTGGGTNGTCNATVNGTYVKNVALTSANTVSLQHTYTAAGTYTVTTDTVNGYSFKKVVTATAGAPATIVLDGAGTPLVEGTNRFKVKFGTGVASDTCSFDVAVNATAPPPGGNTYFPLSLNSYWTYKDPAGANTDDTLKTTNVGTAAFNNVVYSWFVTVNKTGAPVDSSYYRKEAATNSFYRYLNLSDYTTIITFAQPNVEVMFLKETVTTNETWTSATFSGTQGALTLQMRFSFKVIDAAATTTLNSNTFNEVYHIRMTPEINMPGAGWSPVGQTYDFQFAKNVGLINYIDPILNQTPIRFWKIN